MLAASDAVNDAQTLPARSLRSQRRNIDSICECDKAPPFPSCSYLVSDEALGGGCALCLIDTFA